MEKCRELGFMDAVRVKEEINKDALSDWDDAKLEKVAAKRDTKDVFGYNLKQQEPGLGQTQAA